MSVGRMPHTLADRARQRIEQYLSSAMLEAEIHPHQASALERCRDRWLMPFFAVKHQEAAAAGAGQLASNRAMVQGELVQLVNPGVADARRQSLLVLP